MNLKSFILIFSLITVVAIAGCTEKQTDGQIPADVLKQLADAQKKEPIAPPTAEPTPDKKDVVLNAECGVNTDCEDKNGCTTDTCEAGKCKNIVEPDCELKVEQKPKIIDANFGARAEEFVKIDGKNWYLDDYSIENSKGQVLIKFKQKNDQSNKINGKWTIYTSCDLSTVVDKYACKDTEFFADTGDKAVLKDENGLIVDSYPK